MIREIHWIRLFFWDKYRASQGELIAYSLESNSKLNWKNKICFEKRIKHTLQSHHNFCKNIREQSKRSLRSGAHSNLCSHLLKINWLTKNQVWYKKNTTNIRQQKKHNKFFKPKNLSIYIGKYLTTQSQSERVAEFKTANYPIVKTNFRKNAKKLHQIKVSANFQNRSI